MLPFIAKYPVRFKLVYKYAPFVIPALDLSTKFILNTLVNPAPAIFSVSFTHEGAYAIWNISQFPLAKNPKLEYVLLVGKIGCIEPKNFPLFEL